MPKSPRRLTRSTYMLENPLIIAVSSPKGSCRVVDDVVVQLGQPWRGHVRQFQETEDGFEGLLLLGTAEVPVKLQREITEGDIVIKAEGTGKVGQRFSRRGHVVLVNPYNEYEHNEHQSLVKTITGSVNHYLEREARSRSHQPKKQLTTA